MPRIGFRECGFVASGTPSLDPLNGWWWPHDLSSDGIYPVGVTAQTMFDIYWRIKSYRMQAELTFYELDGTTEAGTQFINVVAGPKKDLITPIDPAVGERSLIGGFNLYYEEGTGLFTSFRLSLDLGFSTYIPDIPEFFPNFQLSFNLDETTDVGAPGPPSEVALTFLGYPVQLWHSAGLRRTGTVTITPEEYWSYDGIYDSATGAQNIFPLPRDA